MKILFTAMPVTVFRDNDLISMKTAPSTALYLLSSILTNYNYDVEILDPYTIQRESANNNLINIFEKKLKDINILCLSSNTLNWPLTLKAIKIARKLKKNEIKIILGGLHPTFYYEYIINNFDVDFILRGEGEVSLPKLIQAIEINKGYEKIEGLISKNNPSSKVNLILPTINDDIFNQLPLPSFDKLPKNVYSMMPIETSRGCRFSCKFCSVPYKNNWRMFNTDNVIYRNKQIISNYQSYFRTSQVMITDDCLTTNLKRATKIMNELFSVNSNSSYAIETRATDWLKDDRKYAIDTFSSNQILRLQFGVECGYNEGLKKISKGLTIETLEDILKFLEKNNLIQKAFFSFIIGFPWETIDNCLSTINYAASIERRYGPGIVNLNWLRLYPSSFWLDRKSYGITINEDAFDDELYDTDKYFCLTHPSISVSDKDYINYKIDSYEDMGIYLRNF